MKTSVFLFALLLFASCHALKIAKPEMGFSEIEEGSILSAEWQVPMRVLTINNNSDSIILRTKSTQIGQVNTKNYNLQHFAKRLEATMIAEMGVGIAAPQVGVLKNIICVQRFDKEGFPNEIFINPIITRYSIEKQDCREGCLSIPGRSDTTKIRSLSIDLSYQNLKGKHIQETVTGFTAVIFQHEIDHLNGILYTDHLQKEITHKKH